VAEVVVPTAELVATWQEFGEEQLNVQLLLDRPLAQAVPLAAEALGDAVAGLDDDVISSGEVLVFPRGPVVNLGYCDEQEVLETWLTALAAVLGARGLAGRLEPFTWDDIPEWLVDEPGVVPTLALTVSPDPRYEAGGPPGWHGEPAATQGLLDVLVPWCLDGAEPGSVSLANGVLVQRCDPDALREVVGLALAGQAYADVNLTNGTSADRFRLFRASATGLVTVATGGGPGRAVVRLEELLRRLAPFVESGLLRPAVVGARWYEVVAPDVHVGGPALLPGRLPARELKRMRGLLAGQVADAYGVQLLTDAHLAHVRDLSGWDVEEIAPDRHLVRSREPEPWFAPGGPDDDVLERARDDFGDALLMRP
jgi:hypothetical protein